MRKIGFMPYKETQKEILPKSYRVDARPKQRRMFIAMLNEQLSEAARFDLSNPAPFGQSLLELFNEKILSFFPCHRLRPERPQRVVRIHAHESQLFGAFFNYCSHPRARWLAERTPHRESFRMLLGYAHPAAELIQLIFDGRQIRLTLDLDTLFTHTVFRRIKREPSKTITLDMPYIHIDQHGVRTRLYPRWKQVDPRRLEQRREDIDHGFKQLSDEGIDQMYLLYPKTERFQRHIQLKNSRTDQLKMIPYSFTFTQRKKQSCKR
jgi:hypothetical protein